MVVDSFHTLNRLRRSLMVIGSVRVSVRCLQLERTCWIYLLVESGGE